MQRGSTNRSLGRVTGGGSSSAGRDRRCELGARGSMSWSEAHQWCRISVSVRSMSWSEVHRNAYRPCPTTPPSVPYPVPARPSSSSGPPRASHYLPSFLTCLGVTLAVVAGVTIQFVISISTTRYAATGALSSHLPRRYATRGPISYY